MADDTQALQAALDAGSGTGVAQHKVVYIPNGTYRIRNTLVVNRGHQGASIGPWLYGESRDGVVIRMDDGVEGVTSVLRTHPDDQGRSSANWFMRTVRNLTLDAGNNPKTDGVRWFASNSGLLKDVRIRGNGPCGVNSSFVGENGPNMLQDVEIEGFETGVLSHWFYGQTLSRVTVLNCKKVGVDVVANAVGIEGLHVTGTPLALAVRQPNDWHWWSGTVALVGAELAGSDPQSPAILNSGKLYVRDVKSRGFRAAIEGTHGAPGVAGPDVDEHTSHPVITLREDTPTRSPRLPIEQEPREWEIDPTRWLCANDFGVKHGDNQDDTQAFQQAFDEAARRQATTVYLRGVSGGDPNWYNLEGEVHIRGSVRHVIALGFGRILGGKNGRFIIDDQSAPVVTLRHIDSFGGPPVKVENRSARSTLYVESCGVEIVGNGQGPIFATNVPAHLHLLQPKQPCWVRSLNAEGTSDRGSVSNRGGRLWVMGSKSEGNGLRFIAREGAVTELFGGYEYTTEAVEPQDRRPMFWSDDSTLFAAGVFEVTFTGKPYVVKLRDTRKGDSLELDGKNLRDRIWSVLSTSP
jgi:hypothetical protein